MTATLGLPLAMLALALALASALLGLGAGRWTRLMRAGAVPLFGLSALAALAAGLLALIDGGVASAVLPLGLPWLPWHLRLDALAGFALVIVGGLGGAVALHAADYARTLRDRAALGALGLFSGLFLLGMLLVALADDAFVFMIAWELMSLASYFLVVLNHEQAANRRAAFLYLLMAHVGGLAILLGFGVLAAFGGGFEFVALRAAEPPPVWAAVAFGLALFGFGMKAGLVPLHAWLPEAHPAAPSHISALMSGAMLKVAVYGFIRLVFDLIGQFHWSWGLAVLAVGSLSALMGVLHALMQHDLKRLLAYHSVENLGIVFIGLGLALLFLSAGHRGIGLLALIAALYHSINHAMFKGLLFLGAGAILHSAHERDLEKMGGLLRRIPWTGWFFLIGCLSISALPPFNGFVSEWLTFQAALHAWSLDSGVLRTLVPIAAAVLALTGALAAACFVKVYAVAFLGQARSRHVRRAHAEPPGMRWSQGLLALACVLLGLFPGQMIDLLGAIPTQLLGASPDPPRGGGWLWIEPLPAESVTYSAPLLVLGLTLIVAILVALANVGRRRGGARRARRCDAWDCGFAQPTARMQYSATAFAQPIRRVFAPLFHIHETLDTQPDAGERYRLEVNDRAWELLYKPLARAVELAARRVARLQSGHLRAYLGWTFATLLGLLWIIS